MKKTLSLCLVLVLALGTMMTAGAASDETGGLSFLPAGTYTYVDSTPTAEEDGTGQVQFLYDQDMVAWAIGTNSGTEALSGSTLKFFQGVYLSDRPVTDWFGSAEKDTEGYAGDVVGNFQITIENDGTISCLNVTSPTTRVMAVLSADITAPTLTVRGSTRGQPKLLQSCITLMGSTNALHLTAQGDVILDGLTVGNDGEGNGLSSDKIGGDTFVVDTVNVNGTVEWHNKMGVITALSDQAGILRTNGYDISMTGGSNIGRVGRSLTISTGVDQGGDIYLGVEVTTDATRGGLLPTADTSSDGVTISTSGNIVAGLGDVIIGTNTEKAVNIDIVGNIQGANVIIQPINYGEIADVNGSIGSITATEDIIITVGEVKGETTATSVISSSEGTMEFEVASNSANADGILIGSLTAQNGDITVTTGAVNGDIGSISAPNGTTLLNIGSAYNVGSRMASIIVDGSSISLDSYLIGGNYCLSFDALGSLLPSVDFQSITLPTYSVNGNLYVKLRDVASVANFGVTWDAATGAVVIDTTTAYSAD